MTEVPTSQLVMGDIVDLNIGDKVPADMRLLHVDQLKVFVFKDNFFFPANFSQVDKSMLTGESDPVTCTSESTDANYLESANLVFLGSNVVEGRGRGIVISTGNRTTMGKITIMASAESVLLMLNVT